MSAQIFRIPQRRRVIRRNMQSTYDKGYWDGITEGVIITGFISFWLIVLIGVAS